MDMWEFAEQEALKRGEEAKRLDADPAYQAKMKAKREADFARGVRLGWWDAEGNPIPQDDDPDEDEDTDED